MAITNEVKIIAGISILTLAIVAGAAMVFGGITKQENTEPVKNTDALVRKDSHQTNAKAKVTLVEFGDFQCPACGTAHPVVTKVLETYKGKINFVFRHFPLPQHQNAKLAAEAAEAAGAQGKFFEMYDMIYTNQDEWGESDKAMEYFLKYAKALSLDVDTFKSDVEGEKYAQKIQKDMEDGSAVGVTSTPTFYVNGVALESGAKYDDFKEKIDEALKNTAK